MTVDERLRDHQPIHYADVYERPVFMQRWERLRHRQAHEVVQLIAEAWGVFSFCYPGVGATAALIVGNTLGLQNYGSFLTIGFAYAMGIVFALVTGASTSGGHINPGVTVTLVLFKGFPKWKGVRSRNVRYILAQILGGYVACLLVYVQWHNQIKQVEAMLIANGTFDSVVFTSSGPAGISGIYVAPGTNLGFVFVNELVADFFIAMVIWTTLDPTNFSAPPAAGPWLVGLAYAAAVWAFAGAGLATNTARDLGGRLAAMTIYGSGASGGHYAAITALANILSTNAAYVMYELVFKDSSRGIYHCYACFEALPNSGHGTCRPRHGRVMNCASADDGLRHKSRTAFVRHLQRGLTA
ncbi:aquaporin-like protein [Vararia minispora EC-137]|uniref:Aquaporin-like protein n=1 Tax=Vararia minispora EC-137 TaxID=1314806 RepID=A0ACB8QBX6_9AGAM|nr:aquaporin-like protein [Vararia minispora EC-137]